MLVILLTCFLASARADDNADFLQSAVSRNETANHHGHGHHHHHHRKGADIDVNYNQAVGAFTFAVNTRSYCASRDSATVALYCWKMLSFLTVPVPNCSNA